MKVIFESSSFTISSTLSSKNTPRVDGVFFESMKNRILGKTYDLSLVYIGKKRMLQINTEYRKKKYATDILSFTLDKRTGEICIYPQKARTKSKAFERTYANYLSYILIHGMLHLKGMDHESDADAAMMESAERKWCTEFGI